MMNFEEREREIYDAEVRLEWMKFEALLAVLVMAPLVGFSIGVIIVVFSGIDPLNILSIGGSISTVFAILSVTKSYSEIRRIKQCIAQEKLHQSQNQDIENFE